PWKTKRKVEMNNDQQ
uniref:Uncharacterized protein n=1 Tax=Amphimedon queenslandica TaxID=400682 RepID=A0A1X7TUL7_AMPQE